MNPIKLFIEAKVLLFTLLYLITPSVIADTIPTGTWAGEISVSANKVPLIFHITIDKKNTYKVNMDSPAQGAMGIPINDVKVTGHTIMLNIAAANAIFEGEFDKQSAGIKGVWKQGGHSFPLTLQQKNEDILGLWKGGLQGTSVNLSIEISVTDKNSAIAYLSPNNGISKVKVSNLVNKQTTLSFEVPNEGVTYKGVYSEENKEISGVFSQGGREFVLNFTKSANSQQVKLDRPQHPTKPYTYNSTEVVFENIRANIKLSGTLTTPKGKGNYPAVVLISGSGPQDRDQTFMGHKTFLVLADHLTKSGIAVLRFDDRGVADSTGDFTSATSLDFASDVQAAVEFLAKRAEIDVSNIGLIGHSEGGLIAPIVASKSSDVAFMTLMAGPGISGNDIAVEQIKTILSVNGLSVAASDAGSNITRQLNEVIIKNQGAVNFEKILTKRYQEAWTSIPKGIQAELKKVGAGSISSSRIKTLSSAWNQYFLIHQPSLYLSKTSIPVMAIHGSKDKQMRASANLLAIQAALSPSTKHLVIEIEGVNHLFQTANTGLMSEYSKITETIAPQVLNKMTRWILDVAIE